MRLCFIGFGVSIIIGLGYLWIEYGYDKYKDIKYTIYGTIDTHDENIVVQWFKAIHNKMCPTIEFED
jgi:hypothetical protein